MDISDIKKNIPADVYQIISKDITKLRPAQEKAVKAGLLNGANILVCTPTASGKTLIAEMAMLKQIVEHKRKAIYIVPLKALASEKYNYFKSRYENICKVALSIGDLDSADSYLKTYDIIICTSEKLDSLIRHHTPWLNDVNIVVIDEVHLLNDTGRGPTLEILITLLRLLLKDIQIVALSATIGNPDALAKWLDAELIIDTWRPVKLSQGVYLDGKIEFEDEKKATKEPIVPAKPKKTKK